MKSVIWQLGLYCLLITYFNVAALIADESRIPAHQEQLAQSVADYKPQFDLQLHDVSNDPIPFLKQLPGVVDVQRHGPPRPTHRIVHLLDWHFVDPAKFAADLRSQSDKPISDDQIDRQFEQLLREVELVQLQQMAIIQCLATHHGLDRVRIEGMTDRDMLIIEARMSVLKSMKKEISGFRKVADQLLAADPPNDETKEFIAGIESLENQYRHDLLQLGAAGRLVLSGELEGVLPLEGEAAYLAANPVAEDGSVVLDKDKIEARQDAQVKLLLDKPFAFIVLGGAHDLSDNIERLAGGKAEYIRISPKDWKELSGEQWPNQNEH